MSATDDLFLLELFLNFIVKCGNKSVSTAGSQQVLGSFDTCARWQFDLQIVRNIGQDSEVSFKIDSLKLHKVNSLLSLSEFTYLKK